MFLIQDYPEPDFSRSPREFEELENDAIKQFENWLRKRKEGLVWNMWFDARVRGVIRRQQWSNALIDLTV